MGQHDALRIAGRPGGVHQDSKVVGPQVLRKALQTGWIRRTGLRTLRFKEGQ